MKYTKEQFLRTFKVGDLITTPNDVKKQLPPHRIRAIDEFGFTAVRIDSDKAFMASIFECEFIKVVN